MQSGGGMYAESTAKRLSAAGGRKIKRRCAAQGERGSGQTAALHTKNPLSAGPRVLIYVFIKGLLRHLTQSQPFIQRSLQPSMNGKIKASPSEMGNLA